MPLSFIAGGAVSVHTPFAHILSEASWRCHLQKGGYKAYRRDILDCLAADFSSLPLVIIAGRTGSAKTDILGQIAKMGGQILDLEGLACHRGSLLGRWPDTPQPTQRFFESALIAQVREFDKTRPVYVESESSRIGNLQLPTALWQLMTTSPMVTIETPARASRGISAFRLSSLAWPEQRYVKADRRYEASPWGGNNPELARAT